MLATLVSPVAVLAYRRGAFVRPRVVGGRRSAGRIALGRDSLGRIVRARADANVLVVAPPGAAKTTGVVIPALLEWPGSAVVLSTKPDVLAATRAARSRHGQVLVFDPLGSDGNAGWDPVSGCEAWSVALDRAAALTSATRGEGDSHEARWWDALASDTIAPLLHAAALAGLTMREVYAWTVRQDSESARRILASRRR